MKEDRYHKHRLANHVLHPETLMLGYGYDPLLSEGAVKPPVFLTSTFVRPRKVAISSTTRRGGGNRPRARSVALSTPASITPTARSSKTAWQPTSARKPASCFHRGCRRSRRHS